ncbi:PAS-domain containing protein [Paracoccus sp. Z118]|uniref:PAS-domain containing protein n=1 Tax=Paracoccus sp. Z118 TaxID=2851017 RepID=UPI001C2C5BD3|nr:PAS-domain containing protein [Paracoccus sp. Z118]MBV0891230.1 PAS-domain containing protein [Paracoccus sp. Z118]
MTQDHSELTQSGLNLIAQAISIFDADLRLAVCNRPYQQMFDLPDRLTRFGTRFEDTIDYLVRRGEYGEVASIEEAVRVRVDQARTFQPHYIERTRPNGMVVSVEGAPLSQGGWVAVYTDITGIRRQETLLRARSEELSEQLLAHAERLSAANRALAASNAALREAKRIVTESEARTRQVTEMVPAHIAHVDRDYRYTFSNNQLGAVFPGAGTAGGIVGRAAPDLLGEETFSRIRPHLDCALAGQPQVFEMTHPPTGRRIRIAFNPDRAGGGAYVLSTDVTAEVEAREALTHTARRAVAAQMTSGLAHDFGNLMTIILGLQGRLAKSDLAPAAAADVQATRAAAERGAALLNRIATITGPRSLTPQAVDLPELLGGLAAMARPSLGPGVELALACDLPPGPLLLDPGSLQDSLLNLLLNAHEAMAGQGQIDLTARAAGDWIEITVRDSGPGFNGTTLKRATEPFFTTKAGQGWGLGLPMVYDQTKLAGGTLRLENAPGRGARVRIRLPRRPATPRMTLLVDDDDRVRESVREMLTALGHAVIEAGSLAEARALTDLPGLSLILSDLQLGDGRGADLAGTGLPLLLMTALPPDDPDRAGLAAPVLTKPFLAAELAAQLERLPVDE